MEFVFLIWISVCAATDITYRKCFNWLILSGFWGAVVSAFLNLDLFSFGISGIDVVIGFSLALSVFMIFYIKGLMGAGDVKFAAVLGMFLGWKVLLPIWAISCAFAIIHGVVVKYGAYFNFYLRIIEDQVRSKRSVPYVTYLSVATIFVLMWKF